MYDEKNLEEAKKLGLVKAPVERSAVEISLSPSSLAALQENRSTGGTGA